jgi:hypothetical protein
MIIYDSTSLAFIRKTEEMAREILEKCGLKVNRSRFEWNRFLYPIRVVVFEGPEWGHFNAPYLQIGLNRKLIYQAKDSVIRDIISHELAHYLTYVRFGEVSAHGAEFKEICEEYGFSADVARATMDLNSSNEAKEGDIASEKILEKVKKLLQLAQSSNVHEAELATMKANELLLRNSLTKVMLDDEPIYLERILMQTRKDAKLAAIYDILRHFVVRPVISFGKNSCCLEISGSYTNVRLARYVGEFLYRELDHMWESIKKEHQLSGLRAKNSFFAGVAKGFNEKMKSTKDNLNESDKKALVIVEKKLDHDIKQIYRRLSQSSSHNTIDGRANELGIQKGKSLTIRQGVEGKLKNLYLPIP